MYPRIKIWKGMRGRKEYVDLAPRVAGRSVLPEVIWRRLEERGQCRGSGRHWKVGHGLCGVGWGWGGVGWVGSGVGDGGWGWWGMGGGE